VTSSATSAAFPRSRMIAYRVTTGLVAGVLLVGGVIDVLRIPYVRAVMAQLGYPAYFAVILGAWKVPGAVVLLALRLPRLKEWAYAGAAFTFTGAAASHLAAGDPGETLVAPIILTALTAASRALRPPPRRDLVPC